MANDNIVDNAQEVSLDDPALQVLLNRDTGAAPKQQETGEKKAASPAASAGEQDTNEDTDPVKALEAQVEGLKAELSRRRGNSERVEVLEQQLEELRIQAKKGAENDAYAWVMKLDDDDLVSKQTDWEDELADARARYGRAEEAGDEKSLERHGQRILVAKKTLAAFRKEGLARVTRRQKEAVDTENEVNSIQEEITSMHSAVTEAYPDLLKQDTPLWKAGDQEFRSHPALMKRLGPLGEVVAAAMAIVKNPTLVQAKGVAAGRKTVIDGLEKAVKSQLSTGASAPRVNAAPEINIDSQEGLARFEAMIAKLKGGA